MKWRYALRDIQGRAISLDFIHIAVAEGGVKMKSVLISPHLAPQIILPRLRFGFLYQSTCFMFLFSLLKLYLLAFLPDLFIMSFLTSEGLFPSVSHFWFRCSHSHASLVTKRAARDKSCKLFLSDLKMRSPYFSGNGISDMIILLTFSIS